MSRQYPGLMLRGSRYYLRIYVPADLIESIGREEVWKSLDTPYTGADPVRSTRLRHPAARGRS